MRELPRLTVGAMVFNPSKEKILLLRSPKWDGRYIFPCGHVELYESLVDALRREVKEETALDIREINYLRIIEFINNTEYFSKSRHFVGIQYTCQSTNEEVKLNKEADLHVWIAPSQALELQLESSTRESIDYWLSLR